MIVLLVPSKIAWKPMDDLKPKMPRGYKGAPVEGATVTFFAQGGGKRGAVGRTDASGQFTLTTFDPKDGAIPGSYRVAIEKSVLEGAPIEGATGKAGEEPPAGTVKDLIPSKYKDPNTSGLTADVQEGGVKDLKFDLTD